MDSIIPGRTHVSDRFPVASFTVRAPESRYFEVACATDPRLFHSELSARRNRSNFFSSRSRGLLPLGRDEVTYLLPSEQLQQFAGARRVYYALATYGGPSGEAARFSIHPDALDQVPSIGLAPDFSGKTLDRARIGRPMIDARYGAPEEPLTWGGDAALAAASERATFASPEAYDDGYGTGLWEQEAADGSDDEAPGPHGRDEDEDAEALDAGLDDEPGGEMEPERGGASYEDDELGETYGSPRADQDYDDGPELAEHGDRLDGDPDLGADEAADSEVEDAPAVAALGLPVEVISPPGAWDEAPGYAGGEPRRIGARDGAARRQDAPRARGLAAYGDPTREPGAYEDEAAESDEHAEGDDDGEGVEDAPDAVARGASVQRLGAEPFALDEGERDDEEAREAQADDDDEPELPEGQAPMALELDVAAKLEDIIEVVAEAETGPRGNAAKYASVREESGEGGAYGRGGGIAAGFMHFGQRSGALGKVLARFRDRSPAEFGEVFGQGGDELLRVTNAPRPEDRLAPVGGRPLSDPSWIQRLERAGQKPACCAAQREVAVTEYLDPHLPLAASLGLRTDRALAMLYDRCASMGGREGAAWVTRHAGPIQTRGQLDASLSALGYADLASFQRAAGLPGAGRWNAASHAAIASALRTLGAASPVPLRTGAEMLDRLVDASRGTGFEERMRALRTTRALSDRVYTLGIALG